MDLNLWYRVQVFPWGIIVGVPGEDIQGSAKSMKMTMWYPILTVKLFASRTKSAPHNQVVQCYLLSHVRLCDPMHYSRWGPSVHRILQPRILGWVVISFSRAPQSIWISKSWRNQRSNCQHLLDHGESKGVPQNHLICFTDCAKAYNCVDHNKLWKILKEIGIPENLYPSPEKLVCGSRSNS